MPSRPCLRCGQLTRTGSYCKRHTPSRFNPARGSGGRAATFRRKTLALTGGRCAVCGSDDRVQAHQLHPGRRRPAPGHRGTSLRPLPPRRRADEAAGAHVIVHAECSCGAPLTRRATARDEWKYVDASGHTLVAYPPIPWTELRAHDIAEYSRLSAAHNLGYLPTCHVHHPAHPVHGPLQQATPYCCATPMFLAPSGWRCREKCARMVAF